MYIPKTITVLFFLIACPTAVIAFEKPNRDEKLDELLKLVEKPEAFSPITDEQVEKAKSRLDQAMAKLDRELKAIGSGQETLWKKYLNWDELNELKDSEKPTRSALINNARKYQMNHPGLEMKVFTDVRSAIVNFANVSYFRSEAVAKRIYDDRLRRIKLALEKLKAGYDDKTIGLLGEAVGDLHNSGNCPELVTAIRSAFAKPNFHFQVSERLAKSMLKDRKSVDTRPLVEEILGVWQRGTAHTTSRFDVDFLPSQHTGRFKIRIDGNTISDTVGTKELGLLGNVYICSEGNTCLVGEAVIDFDGKRLSYSNLAAGARTNTHIKGVNTPPLLRGATLNQIDKQKSQGEREAAMKARAKFVREIRSQLNSSLGKANKELKEGVGTTVRRLDFEPKRLEVSTSDTAFRVLAIVGNQRQLTSLVGPDSSSKGDVITQLHESTINNGLQHLLGGRRVSMDELRKLITSFGVELPPPPEDDKPLTITFPRNRPVQVSFDNQQVTTVISANQIESGRTVVRDKLTITIKYSVDSTSDSVQVTLAEDASIDFAGAYTNSKSIIESVIKPRLDKAVKKETRKFSLSELDIPDEIREMGLPELTKLEFKNGWMVAELGISEKKVAEKPAKLKISDSGTINQIRSGVPVRPLRQSQGQVPVIAQTKPETPLAINSQR